MMMKPRTPRTDGTDVERVKKCWIYRLIRLDKSRLTRLDGGTFCGKCAGFDLLCFGETPAGRTNFDKHAIASMQVPLPT